MTCVLPTFRGIDVLVVLDFLLAVGARIDLAKVQVMLGNQKVPIHTQQLEPTITAHAMEESCIPAYLCNKQVHHRLLYPKTGSCRCANLVSICRAITPTGGTPTDRDCRAGRVLLALAAWLAASGIQGSHAYRESGKTGKMTKMGSRTGKHLEFDKCGQNPGIGRELENIWKKLAQNC